MKRNFFILFAHILIISAFFAISYETAAAAPVEVNAWSVPRLKVTTSVVKLRLFATETFTGSTGNMIQGGTIGTPSFYTEIECSVSNGIVTIPALTVAAGTALETTTDALDRGDARFMAILYDENGYELAKLINDPFRVHEKFGNLTVEWVDIILENKQYPNPFPQSVLADILLRINLGSSTLTGDPFLKNPLRLKFETNNGAPPDDSDDMAGRGAKISYYPATGGNAVSVGIENNAHWLNLGATNRYKIYWGADPLNLLEFQPFRFYAKTTVGGYNFQSNAPTITLSPNDTGTHDFTNSSYAPRSDSQVNLGLPYSRFSSLHLNQGNGLFFSDGSTGINLFGGPGAPSSASENGSIYFRRGTNDANQTFYFRANGIWEPLQLTGLIDPARLGTGSAHNGSFLAGDNSWRFLDAADISSGTFNAARLPALGGDIGGTYSNMIVTRIYGKNFQNATYSNNQFPCWDNSTTQFVPCSPTTASLPAQSGQNGKFLKTDGTAATWSIVGMSDVDGLSSQLTNFANQLNALDADKAPKASPALTGNPTAPTPAGNDNDTSIATTGWVQTEITEATAAGGSPTGAAGGDLTGSYPNPIVNQIQGRSIVLTPEPVSFNDDFSGASLDAAKWNDTSVYGTPVTVSGGHAYSVTAGTFGNLNLETDALFDFRGKTVTWEVDLTHPNYSNDTVNADISLGLIQGACLSGANNCGYFTGFYGYNPNVTPTSISIRYNYWQSNGGTFITTKTLTGAANKFRLIDTVGTMEYYVMYVGQTTWTLIHTFDYSGDLYDTTMKIYASGFCRNVAGAHTVHFDKIYSDVYETTDSMTDKSLIWWDVVQNRWEDGSLSSVKAAMEALGISASNGLPTQTGHSGKYLTTNGATSSWATIPTGATGAAAGDLAGTYPNPTIGKLQSRSMSLTPLPNPFADEFNGTFDSTRWTTDTQGATRTQSGGYLYVVAGVGTGSRITLASNSQFNFTSQTVQWEYDFSTVTAPTPGDWTDSALMPAFCTNSPNNCGRGTGFRYAPVGAPTTLFIYYDYDQSTGAGSFSLTKAIASPISKFRLVDVAGTMEYWVMYSNSSVWTLLHTYDYSGSLYDSTLTIYSNSYTAATNGSTSAKLDRIESTVLANSDTMADKSMIWWDAADTRFEDTTLTGLKTALEALGLTASNGLPTQTGHSGKYLTTNGTSASWGTVPPTTAAGSSGSIQFNGGSGNTFAADASNLHWDNVNTRLCLGTTGCADRLTVQGNIAAAGGFQSSFQNVHASGDTRLALKNNGTGALLAQVTGSSYGVPNVGAFSALGNLTALGFVTNGDVLSGGTSYIYFNTGGFGSSQERLRIFGNGNVAVGTTTDNGQKFYVNGVGFVNGKFGSAIKAMTFNTTTAVNWNEGNLQTVTLTGNTTFTFSNASANAMEYVLVIKQDGVGGRVPTFPTVKWQGGAAPAWTSTASKTDIVICRYDGTDFYCKADLNY